MHRVSGLQKKKAFNIASSFTNQTLGSTVTYSGRGADNLLSNESVKFIFLQPKKLLYQKEKKKGD